MKMVIVNGDSIEYLKSIDSGSLDSLITDPPAGINFMGKDWDTHQDFNLKMEAIFKECLRVLKPGAHGLVWAIPRTSHWTARALEDAGFEIRDVITHIFGSGFPKSTNIEKQLKKIDSDEAKNWQGFGTALKPASEHWILVRKPISEKTIAKNVLKHGTGGLNIDETRIGNAETWKNDKNRRPNYKTHKHKNGVYGGNSLLKSKTEYREDRYHQGRFPSNLVLSHNEDCDETCTEGCAVSLLDEQSGISKSLGGTGKIQQFKGIAEMNASKKGANSYYNYGDKGGASRFFYCAKASKRDRGQGNNHPTVKSTKLMEYLIKLITPPNGAVLDPFMGSGSTGVAAKRLGFKFIGIEKEKEYYNIANRRISSHGDQVREETSRWQTAQVQT